MSQPHLQRKSHFQFYLHPKKSQLPLKRYIIYNLISKWIKFRHNQLRLVKHLTYNFTCNSTNLNGKPTRDWIDISLHPHLQLVKISVPTPLTVGKIRDVTSLATQKISHLQHHMFSVATTVRASRKLSH
jgi:hypothetical protein